MSRQRLVSLEIDNFRLIGHVEWLLPTNGIHVIQGENHDKVTTNSNGSSKSTLADAIYFLYTGNSLESVAVGDLVNWSSKTGMYVRGLIMKDDHTYSLIRSRNHPQYGTSVVFTCDTDPEFNELHKSDDREKLIQSVFGFDWFTFTTQAYLTSDMTSKFSMLTDNLKKEVIETAFNVTHSIDLYKTRLDKRYTDNDKLINTLNNTLENINKNTATAESELTNLKAKKTSLFDESKVRIDELTANTSTLTSKSDELTLEISRVSERVITGKASIVIYSNILNSLSSSISLNKDLYNSINLNISNITNKINTHKTHVEKKICSECERPFEDVSKIIETIASLEIEKLSLQTQVDQLKLDITKDELLYTEQLKLKSDTERSINSDELLIQQYQNQINLNNQSIIHNNESITSLNNPIDSYTELINNKQSSIDELVSSIDNSIKELTSAKIKKSQYDDIYKLLSPSGIRAVLLEFYINELNSKLFEISNEILKGDYTVQLNYNPNNGKIVINIDGTEGGYKNISKGEKAVIDFIIQFSLYMCNFNDSTPFLILDELFTAIDNRRFTFVLNYLDQIAIDRPIFVVTHNEYAAKMIDNKITMIRENNVATMVTA